MLRFNITQNTTTTPIAQPKLPLYLILSVLNRTNGYTFLMQKDQNNVSIITNHTSTLQLWKRKLISASLTKGSFFFKNSRTPTSVFVKEDALLRHVLLRFLETWLGCAANVIVYRNATHYIPQYALVVYKLLHARIVQFVPNASIFGLGMWDLVSEALVCSAFFREPTLLISWLNFKLKRINAFSHRKFFRMLGLFLSSLFKGETPLLTGVTLYVVGKISVTGNAMSRSQFAKYGTGGYSNLKTQVYKGFTLVRTDTGCLGLTIHYYY